MNRLFQDKSKIEDACRMEDIVFISKWLNSSRFKMVSLA
jgi:hypothetical protein